jgi:hypothetical protein
MRRLDARNFSLPRPAGAVWRDQHPLIRERVKSAMRIFGQFQSKASLHSTMIAGENGTAKLAGSSRAILWGISQRTSTCDREHIQGFS